MSLLFVTARGHSEEDVQNDKEIKIYVFESQKINKS